MDVDEANLVLIWFHMVSRNIQMTGGTDVIFKHPKILGFQHFGSRIRSSIMICIHVIYLTWMVWDLEIELPKIFQTTKNG